VIASREVIQHHATDVTHEAIRALENRDATLRG